MSKEEREAFHAERRKQRDLDRLTRDVRTIFLGQLQQKATARDIRKFLRAVGGVKVTNVELIRDRRSGRHKGFAYVELKTLEDVPRAMQLNGQRFQFRPGTSKAKIGFPILIKGSEAQRNFAHQQERNMNRASTTKDAAEAMGVAAARATKALEEAQQAAARKAVETRLYVHNIHSAIGETELRSILEPYGKLDHVAFNKAIELAEGVLRPGYVATASAMVTFCEAEHAVKALTELNGMDVGGVELSVARADGMGAAREMARHAVMAQHGNLPMATSLVVAPNAAELALAQASAAGAASAAAPALVASAASAAGGAPAAPAWPQPSLQQASQQLQQQQPGAALAASGSHAWKLDATSGRHGGVRLDAAARASMMANYAMSQPGSSAAAGAAQGGAAAAAAASASAPAPSTSLPIGDVSACLVLKNMFDPALEAAESGAAWAQEIEEDVVGECAKFGRVLHSSVDAANPSVRFFVRSAP